MLHTIYILLYIQTTIEFWINIFENNAPEESVSDTIENTNTNTNANTNNTNTTMNLNITNNTNTNTTPTCGILYQYWVYIQLCVSMCIGTLKANNNPYKSTLLECLDRVFMINNRYPMGNSSNRSSSTGVYGGNNDINSSNNCKNSTNDNGINNNSNTNSNNDMTIQYILQLICAIMIPDVLYWIKIAIVYSCTHPIYSTTNKIMSYLYHSCLYQQQL